MWYVYILECEKNQYYVGQTADLPNRLIAHISGRGSVFTKNNTPLRLHYIETALTREKAIKRESWLTKQRDKNNLVLDSIYTGFFEYLATFVKVYGKDCWKGLQDKSLSLSFCNKQEATA